MSRSEVDEALGNLDLGRTHRKGGGGGRRFAILRLSKLSGLGKVSAAAMHNFRERETPNADPQKLDNNRILHGARTTEELMSKWHDLAPEKIRKNAVHGLEYVITASPEKLASMGAENRAAYFDDALDWLKDKHGEENILSAVVHEDEKSPHLQVLVIPLDERGKLNARALVGGKPKLRSMQTDFAERVGLKHGLERGVERSSANHQTLKEFYALPRDIDKISFDVPERNRGNALGIGRESESEWTDRATEAMRGTLRASELKMLSEAIRAEEASERAAQALSERDVTTESLRIVHVLHKTLHETGHWDDLGKEALESYRAIYDDMPAQAREIADSLLERMEETTVPEQRALDLQEKLKRNHLPDLPDGMLEAGLSEVQKVRANIVKPEPQLDYEKQDRERDRSRDLDRDDPDLEL